MNQSRGIACPELDSMSVLEVSTGLAALHLLSRSHRLLLTGESSAVGSCELQVRFSFLGACFGSISWEHDSSLHVNRFLSVLCLVQISEA